MTEIKVGQFVRYNAEDGKVKIDKVIGIRKQLIEVINVELTLVTLDRKISVLTKPDKVNVEINLDEIINNKDDLTDLLEVEDIVHCDILLKNNEIKKDVFILKDKHYLEFWQKAFKNGFESQMYKITGIELHENRVIQDMEGME